jgi:hypothetical protein
MVGARPGLGEQRILWQRARLMAVMGYQDLTLEDEKNEGRRPKSDPVRLDKAEENPRKKKQATPEFGSALRTVYDETLREDIPPEMLDLLGKLG